ncbi:ribulose-phosphate 3-epimerase [Enterococcus sp. AZ163]|uniref:ribulose-phosphate 3-epimerase n=1 Tax=Enterococcus sp. AZ163 TaxID=2774638 RepID=UPI003D283825
MKLLPSLMCLDFSQVDSEIKKLDEAGVDGYHIDVIDGHFVKSFGLGQQDIQAVKRVSKKPLDVHLMTKSPYQFIDYFELVSGDMVHIHPEVDPEPSKTIQKIKEKGLKASIVLSPSTSICTIQELLPMVDAVLVMTVNLGFAGQKYLDLVDAKIQQLANLREEKAYSFEIYTDGALSPDKIENQLKMSVDGFVLGTSALFKKEETYDNLIKSLRSLEA